MSKKNGKRDNLARALEDGNTALTQYVQRLLLLKLTSITMPQDAFVVMLSEGVVDVA
jgi:hypothetical protein